MKAFLRPAGILFLLLFTGATLLCAQTPGAKVSEVKIKFIGPSSVSEALIRPRALRHGTILQRPRRP
jgi:hypothetical protein